MVQVQLLTSCIRYWRYWSTQFPYQSLSGLHAKNAHLIFANRWPNHHWIVPAEKVRSNVVRIATIWIHLECVFCSPFLPHCHIVCIYIYIFIYIYFNIFVYIYCILYNINITFISSHCVFLSCAGTPGSVQHCFCQFSRIWSGTLPYCFAHATENPRMTCTYRWVILQTVYHTCVAFTNMYRYMQIWIYDIYVYHLQLRTYLDL